MTRRPLVIGGPTATGKSSLGLALAEKVGSVEIVSADAKAVYRRMDVGTAKPSLEERARVPHHLVDVADPTDDYTVSLFTAHVTEVLDDLGRRDVTPILVGGTGLYVQAVVDGFAFPGEFPEVAADLDRNPDTAALHRQLAKLDPEAASKMLDSNRRRIIRALEVTLGSGKPFSSFGPGVNTYPETDFVLVGLEIDRAIMDQRIDDRYDEQLEAGFLSEVEQLRGLELSRTASQALGYRELLSHLDGEIGLDEAMDLAKRRTKKFARRQQRWFRRDPRIQWFDAMAPDLVDQVENWWGEAS